MFCRIIIRSLSTCGMCRNNSEITFKLIKNLPLKLKLVSTNKRYLNIISVSYANKQNPKQEHLEVFHDKEIKKPELNQNLNSPSEDLHSQQSNPNNQKKQENEETNNFSDEKTDDEAHQRYKKTKEEILGKSLIVHTFANADKKEKETFLECLRMYEKVGGAKREKVSFIYAALKYMEEFGVHKDLETYKKIIDIFPKEKMIPTNQFQTLFMHYPREQYCCVAVLEQMENFSVIPDPEMEDQLISIFGRHGLPLQKYWKMMYWMPKFKNLNPWPVPNPIPNDPYELAALAMKKISSIDVKSEITIFNSEDIEDSIDKTWIVSAMAPAQSELLLKHNKKTPIFVEGPFVVYVATKSVDYFTLRADPIPNRKFPSFDPDDITKIRNPYLETKSTEIILAPTVHEQVDGTIFANCATGTSTKDSLLSWIRCLQKSNPVLGEIPIVFKLKNYIEDEKQFIEGDVANKQLGTDDTTKFIKP